MKSLLFNIFFITAIGYHSVIADSDLKKRYIPDFYENLYDDFDDLSITRECKQSLETINVLSCYDAIKTPLSDISRKFDTVTQYEICDPDNEEFDSDVCQQIVLSTINDTCEILKAEECKAVLSENAISNFLYKTRCDVRNSQDRNFLRYLAGAKGAYLALCGKSDSGNMCPLTDMLSDGAIRHFFQYYNYYSEVEIEGERAKTKEPYLDLVPPKVFNAMVDDCKDTSCNKRMTDFDHLVRAVEQVLMKDGFKGVFKNSDYGFFYEYYRDSIESYRNKQCTFVRGSNDFNFKSRATDENE